jgi:hypothetical protein
MLYFDFVKSYSKVQLGGAADTIVKGTVESSTESKGSDFPITSHNFKVERIYKGNPKLTKLSFNQIGDSTTGVSESALLRKGTEVVLFLRPGMHGSYNLVNEGQGIFVKNNQNGKYVRASNAHQ